MLGKIKDQLTTEAVLKNHRSQIDSMTRLNVSKICKTETYFFLEKKGFCSFTCVFKHVHVHIYFCFEYIYITVDFEVFLVSYF